MNEANKENSYAWAAGLIDGEGSIGFYRRETRYGGKYYLMLRVVMTEKIVLDKLINIFKAGTVKGPYSTDSKDGIKRRNRWSWNCTQNKEIFHILSAIRPFSVLKRSQIDLALKWLNDPPWQRMGKKTYHKMFQLKRNLTDTEATNEEVLPLLKFFEIAS